MSQVPLLRGEFVDLRPITVADAAITLEWRLSPRARLLNEGAGTVEEQARWISSRPAVEQNFIIQLKDGRPIGMLALKDIDRRHRRAESARFLIGDEEAARGLPAAVEAMKLLYELAFDRLKLARVYGTVVEGNERMLKWQKFFGMKEEGRLRHHYFMNGCFRDAVLLGLLEDEYRTTSLPRMRAVIAATTILVSKGASR